LNFRHMASRTGKYGAITKMRLYALSKPEGKGATDWRESRKNLKKKRIDCDHVQAALLDERLRSMELFTCSMSGKCKFNDAWLSIELRKIGQSKFQ